MEKHTNHIMKGRVSKLVGDLEKEALPSEAASKELVGADVVRFLIEEAKKLFALEKNLLKLNGNVVVVSDLHGCYYEAVSIVKQEVPKESVFLFLGNYVDHGLFSVETIAYLLAKKLLEPEKFFFLRGAHEMPKLNKFFGLFSEIEMAYSSDELWYKMNELFRYLPLAAVVNNTHFCVSSGISPDFLSVEKLGTIDRTSEQDNTIIDDILYSHYDEETDTWNKNLASHGYTFGKNQVDAFLRGNRLDVIVRGNDLVPEGYLKQYNDKIITVWSSPNYGRKEDNKASIYLIAPNKSDCKFIAIKQVNA